MIEGFARKIRGIMVKLPGMIDCKQVESFLLAYIEDDLPKSQMKVIDRHLMVCPDCRRYIADYRRTLEVLNVSKLEEDEALAEVPKDLIKAILEASKA
ncbi:anti-sigma factor family protein [Sulfitobacter sp.]|jgi:predicted anti-sigma-YlaC factor YlaD|uniref:anti-sigma factor family protein n=1 Tax=Sulfitobacter sp. TaxID=1903071 RepID=UPI00304A15D6